MHGGVARLAVDGTLDTSYGNAGLVVLEPGGSIPSRSNAKAILLQQDQRAIIVGNRSETDDTARATMTRLNSDGSVDTSFGTPLPDAVPGVASDDYAQYAFNSPGYSVFYGWHSMRTGSSRAARSPIITESHAWKTTRSCAMGSDAVIVRMMQSVTAAATI